MPSTIVSSLVVNNVTTQTLCAKRQRVVTGCQQRYYTNFMCQAPTCRHWLSTTLLHKLYVPSAIVSSLVVNNVTTQTLCAKRHRVVTGCQQRYYTNFMCQAPSCRHWLSTTLLHKLYVPSANVSSLVVNNVTTQTLCAKRQRVVTGCQQRYYANFMCQAPSCRHWLSTTLLHKLYVPSAIVSSLVVNNVTTQTLCAKRHRVVTGCQQRYYTNFDQFSVRYVSKLMCPNESTMIRIDG